MEQSPLATVHSAARAILSHFEAPVYTAARYLCRLLAQTENQRHARL